MITKIRYPISLFVSIIVILTLIFSVPFDSFAKKSSDTVLKKQTQKKKSASRKKRSSTPGIQTVSKNPYLGAIVIDANTGEALFEDNPDAKGYPASMVKMMNFLIMLEGIESKRISINDKVRVSAEAAGVGGSQVYLKVNEVFTVDDLLYALIIKSANDAAMALALHYTGNKNDFIDLMNKKAQELGMKDTVFRTVNGLPVGKKPVPDVSTPRDMARLSQELLKHPSALRYTSTQKRLFRANSRTPMLMRNHNHLVGNFEGCDGLKTGYFRAAGFSIAATAVKKEERAIAVIFGSVDRNVRDAKARDLLSIGLSKMLTASSSFPYEKGQRELLSYSLAK